MTFQSIGDIAETTGHVDITPEHGVGFSVPGLIAQIPVAGGGAVGYVPLYKYAEFTWDGFRYNTQQFVDWMHQQHLSWCDPKKRG